MDEDRRTEEVKKDGLDPEDSNSVMALIDELYSMVSEAWGVPLGNDKCLIEREKVLDLLDEIKTQMPVELSEAKRLVSARDEFISNAKREAESVRKLAEEKARTLLSEQEIVRVAQTRSRQMMQEAEFESQKMKEEAQEKSQKLLTEASEKSDQLRRVAGKYAEDVLRDTEQAVFEALDRVRQQRKAFMAAATEAMKDINADETEEETKEKRRSKPE